MEDSIGMKSNGLPPLKRIAAVHDISGVGKCSLTVALPVISAAGVECAALPTALLSTHTGEFSGFTFLDLSGELLPIAEHWKREGIAFDGVYSGYLASPGQARLLESVISELRNEDTLIIIDPVMADNGAFYSSFDGEMCEAFRHLCSIADVVTPNITEAALLTGMEYKSPPHDEGYILRLLKGLIALGPRIAAVTGVCPTRGENAAVTGVCPHGGNEVGVAVLVSGNDTPSLVLRPRREGVFYGTGDLFASAFSALLVRGADVADALAVSVELVGESIERTITRGVPRRLGVDFEGALPGFMQNVGRLMDQL